MPNSRHQRNHRHREEDTHNNNNQHAPVLCSRETAAAAGTGSSVSSAQHHHTTGNPSHQNDGAGAKHQKCCTPGVCPTPDETIDPEEPFDAVRVLCNNESCTEGCWMHKDCFEDFEQSVLAYLRSCGRARSWSEKQRLQNLWTKKGYDLAFKACDCKCGRGHIRKDLDYIPKPFNENSKKQKKHKKKNDKPMPVVSTTHKANSHSNQTNNNSNVGHSSNGNGHHGTTAANAAAATTSTAPTGHASATNGHHTRGHQFLNHAAANAGVGGGRSEKKGKKSSSATKSQDTRKSDSNGNPRQPQEQEGALDNHTATTTITTTTTTKTMVTSVTTNGHVLTTTNNGNNNNSSTSGTTSSSTNTNVFQAGFPGSQNHQHNHHPQLRLRTNSVSSTGSAGSHCSSSGGSSIPSSAGSPSPISSSPPVSGGDMFFKSRKSSDASTGSSSDGSTHSSSLLSSSSPSSTGFRRRTDLSAFTALPRNKQNPYHIRMEDAGTLAYSFASACSMAAAARAHHHPLAEAVVAGESGVGCCDLETRNFVLSNLQSKKMSCSRCALCKAVLPVFDCFPLLDGTFFLSPQSYDETAIQVIWDGRLQFLNAACLSCLQGYSKVQCLACKRPWDGCNLVVGSMYTYDIFAATPCCQKRLTCKCCFRAVVDITKGLPFYSQYSQMIICPYCKANDYHFIRSLAETFSMRSAGEEGAAGQGEPICH